jgi:[CysO sulfur-carrier protein]-S-L-cysteine hydrolase
MLAIPQWAYARVLAEAQAAFPLEVCGLMAGRDGVVRHLYPVDNILQSPSAFQMEPRQQVEAMLQMEKQGWTLLAIYHSHPHGPAEPSAADVAQAYYPEAIQIIVSLRRRQRPLLGAFLIENGRVQPVEWRIVQP